MRVICTSSNISGLIIYLFILSLNTWTYFLSAQHSAEINEPKNPPLLLKRSLLIKLYFFIIPWENKNISFKKSITLFLALLHLCCYMQAFSSCGRRGLLFVGHGLLFEVLSLVEHGLRCMGFSICSTRAQCCGSWAQLLHSMQNLPRPGIEPVSPALAGGFLSTVPPGTFELLFPYWSSHSASGVLLESKFKELFLHLREVSKK